ncbi:hypothetical protein CN575_10400 [Bacillus wiedmannii]|jgi:hypothetical protein|uniref:Uncharacterized protein n=2 Tax=Bacillus cereus group TaxID=86661 RepID=A0A2C4PY82_9BACI|nr:MULTISPECIES: hypothetical protein [Bacillus]AZJ21834.1 hypothetical protein CT694_20160 [Bacillus wiedmannii bv. thuringiensis]KAA0746086.1 hypothetical protein DN389_10985 [Bacillus sp. AY3-1]KAA0772742.1 hypothetical protein DT250_13115 [Bacillus sp. AR2-1]KPU55835.1 hypothetical protein AN402_3725 [Bacillus wiedmannii]MBJ8109374.1 hypothetical protein [Bacillus cereus group sp. N6]
MKKIKKFAGVALAGTVGLSGLLFLEPSVSAAETKQVKEGNFNAIDVTMNQSEFYVLSGRSIDILSGDKEAIQLNNYTIRFSKPGKYVIKVNGCIYDDVYTFIVNE